MKRLFLAILIVCLLFFGVHAQTTTSLVSSDPNVNQIFQYFAASTMPKASANSGAYLWIPPNTPQIRAVMVGIQNGLPICILQNAAVRAVCRQYGIAQILMTPNGSEIGPVMLKGLSYDFTDPERTAVYDLYMQTLAELSGHPELVTAPIVPLAHSAYCSFPFEAAARDPDRCLASIPIKAGLPDLYKMYGAGGGSKTPKPDVNLRSIPILFISSQSQETVGWSAYPRGPGAPFNYRKDRNENTGEAYEPGNDLFGVSNSMMSGHFDMLPRDYEYVADWLGAVAKLRLPDKPGDPLKTVFLKDGWLMQPAVPTTGPVPADYPQPAPYADYKGVRAKSMWYPTEELARRQFEICRDEPRKKVEIFTLLDPKGQPLSLAHGHMATMTDCTDLLTGEGEIMLTTHHYNKPPDICTVKDKAHPKDAAIPCQLSNVAFPGQETLPVSGLPLHFDMNSSPFELLNTEPFTDERGISATRLKLRIRYNRFVGEQIYTVNRIYEDGNAEFAPSGRSVLITWWLGGLKDFGGKPLEGQKITFDPIADVPLGTDSVPLKAKSSSGLNVNYFVSYGPGVIKDGTFIPTEIPVGATKPITVTIGAYHPGMYSGEKLYKPASVVYQTFHLTP